MKKIYAVFAAIIFAFPLHAYAARELVPVGRAVGIQLHTDGLLVIGSSPISGRDVMRESGIHVNDRILSADGKEIHTTEEFASLVNEKPDGITLTVARDNQKIEVNAVPARDEDGVYRLGLWVRDSCAGIGTVTYFDPENKTFAALGHPVNDVDTGSKLYAKSGIITDCRIVSVTKSSFGMPGEINAMFGDTKLGVITGNTSEGIFGSVSAAGFFDEADALPVAESGDVHEGDAYILSDIFGSDAEKYAVSIKKVTGDEGRELVLEVTDERLLNSAGGIVQGMSGSPVIQDNMLVGAVTHVFVNSPSCGYGTLAEKMLEMQNAA